MSQPAIANQSAHIRLVADRREESVVAFRQVALPQTVGCGCQAHKPHVGIDGS